MPSVARQTQARPAQQWIQVMSESPNMHFFHYPMAMRLDGSFGTAQRAGDMLVRAAANDKIEDFPFARRQCLNARTMFIKLVLQVPEYLVTC